MLIKPVVPRREKGTEFLLANYILLQILLNENTFTTNGYHMSHDSAQTVCFVRMVANIESSLLYVIRLSHCAADVKAVQSMSVLFHSLLSG